MKISPFRLTPHALRLTFLILSLALLLLGTPAVLHAQWGPDVRLTYNDSLKYTTGLNGRCVAAGGDGVHVVWTDYRNFGEKVYYKRSTDGGATWGPDFRLTASMGASAFPSVAASDTNVHVIFGSNRDGNDEIYYRRSTDGGTSWGPETRLTNNDSMSDYPSVAVSGVTVHVAWMDTRTGWGIYYKQSTDGGTSWQPDTHLCNVVSGYYPPAPSVAVSGSGVHIAWEDFRNGIDDIYYIHSTDGGATWGSEVRLTNGSSYSLSPSIGVSDSSVHVVWSDLWNGYNSQICYVRSTDGGSSWSPTVRLTYDTTFSESPSVIVSGGNVHLVWQDSRDGNEEIYYKLSTDGGLTWQPDTRLTFDTSASIAPSVAVSGQKVHVVWSDQRDGHPEIYYKHNPTGNIGVEEFPGHRPQSIEVRLKIVPNPFAFFTTIPGHASERFSLYDVSGREVGVYKGDRIGQGLPAGVYFLRASGEGAKPLRIVKLR